jgi:hypothetical protein
MINSETSERALEAQLEMLRSVNTADSAKRVQDGIASSTRQQRRHVLFATVGAAIAAIATIHFILQGEPFGYFALSFTTVVMVIATRRSANRASDLATLKSGASLLAAWRDELKEHLRHTLIAPLVTLGFGVLTACLVARHGTLGFKSMIFLVTTGGLFVFATYQLLVVRPQLKREMEMLSQDD